MGHSQGGNAYRELSHNRIEIAGRSDGRIKVGELRAVDMIGRDRREKAGTIQNLGRAVS